MRMLALHCICSERVPKRVQRRAHCLVLLTHPVREVGEYWLAV
jgi:hypothetical protein